MRLTEGESVQEHIQKLTEIFDELAVIGNPVEEEDRVVHLLASLPESYNVLVTALEANSEVPKMEVVTERLLHEERKQKEKEGCTSSSSKALSVSRSKKVPKCFHCGKPGHIKKNQWDDTLRVRVMRLLLNKYFKPVPLEAGLLTPVQLATCAAMRSCSLNYTRQ